VRVLLVGSYYPEYLKELYARAPDLAQLPYDRQLRQIFGDAFGAGDAYVAGLRAAGCEAEQVIVNADAAQARWAADRQLDLVENIHDRRRQIVAAQVEDFRPDVLYVFEWCPLGDAFLADIKPAVRLVAGQVASPLHANRTYRAFDLMISSYPPLVDHFRSIGVAAEPMKLAFDERIVQRLRDQSVKYDVTFVGGFAPSHTDRIDWLEAILKELPVDVFAYGIERVPADSPIHRCYRGQAWGLRMYEVLQQSRVTLNFHARIEIDGRHDARFANNMRLYEATGVGTCLATEYKENLAEMFEPDREVVAYTSVEDCVGKIKNMLSREDRRREIAQAGQKRTLREHTYTKRMAALRDVLKSHL